jgi:hypothetical protein
MGTLKNLQENSTRDINMVSNWVLDQLSGIQSNCQNTPRKQDSKFSCGKYIKIGPFSRCFCCQEAYTLSDMYVLGYFCPTTEMSIKIFYISWMLAIKISSNLERRSTRCFCSHTIHSRLRYQDSHNDTIIEIKS